MKKIFLGASLILLSLFGRSQGLQKLIIEKYYVSNAADSVGSIGLLPKGSVTWRFFVKMAPGYKFQEAFGSPTHTLSISTTTSFFNNEDRGSTSPNSISVANTIKNSVMIDSWFSVGATATGKMGVPKPQDTDGSLLLSTGILQNTDASAGTPIKTEDGMVTGSPQSVTFVGFDPTAGVFDASSQFGNNFTTTNGAWASLNGSVGADTTNTVLIGQFTTTGVLGYELNIQIGTPSGGTIQYVPRNATGAEVLMPSLMFVPPVPPTASITAPANNSNYVTGDVVAIAATAASSTGTIASVQFFVDGVSIGSVTTPPYIKNYTSVAGTHTLTVQATDNTGLKSAVSAPVTITVGALKHPSVSITSPVNNANFIAGDVVNIQATAADSNATGTVSFVQFFVDGVLVNTDSVSPYHYNWTSTLGNHILTALAKNNKGLTSTSAPVNIKVNAVVPPTVSITAPANGAIYTAPAVVNITATAADPNAGGSITSVQFFVNGVSIGTVTTSPYQINWTSVIGDAKLTALATDNRGASTTSAIVDITIADPNALPYTVVNERGTCGVNTFCIPVAAVDSVKNVIGYDVVMHYDKSKVKPTGNVTIQGDLINASYASQANSIDTVAANITLTIFLNSNAPSNAGFNGKGKVFCAEFTRAAGFRSVDTALFTVPSLQESYFSSVKTQLCSNGTYISYKDSSFHGTLDFWADNSPIRYNVANPGQYLITNIFGNNTSCSSKVGPAVQPDTAGKFIYIITKGPDVDIDRDVLNTTDVLPVINGADALLIQKTLLNDPTFTPSIYQIIAEDVNLDGTVSAGDLSQESQRSVLRIGEYKQAWNYNNQGVSNGQLSKDWLFVDNTLTASAAYQKSSTFPNDDGSGYSKHRVPHVPFCLPVPVTGSVCPLFSSDVYQGIMIGDVDGNYKSIPADGLLKAPVAITSKDKIIFDLSKSVVTGNKMTLPIFFSSDTAINALDFSFQVDPTIVKFDTAIAYVPGVSDDAFFNPSDNTLRFTSSSVTNYTPGQVIANLQFTVLKPFSDADINSVKGYLDGVPSGITIIDGPLNVATLTGEAVVRVYPNPASSTLNIELAEKATIQMTDVDGRVVYTLEDAGANSTQRINTGELANGIYLLKVYNGSFVSVKKVVIYNK